MSLGKRLFIGGEAAAAATSETADIFGDSSGLALYTLDYDASDESGNYDGTPTDVEFGVDGQINWGASFNGTSSKITLPTGSPFNDSNTIKSISGWVKADTTSSRVYLYSHSSSTNASDYFYVGYLGDLNRIYVAVRDGGSANQNNRYADITSDTDWNHIVAQLNGSTVEIWLNGVQQTVTNNTTGTATNSSWIDYPSYESAVVASIGIQKANNPNYSNGLIDQVRIFNKAISSSEVSTLYGETATVYTATTDDNAYQAFNVGYWKLDNNGDDEKNTYDATENNITYEFGRYGQAASFNGTNSYLQVSHDNSFNWTSFNTLSLWVNFDTINSGNTVGIAAKGANSSNFGWYLYKLNSDDSIYFQSYNTSDAASTLDSGVVPIAGNWYHICVTGDSTTNKLYINGVEKDSASAVTATSTNDNLIFGRFYSNVASNHFEGKIDQIRWFNTALGSTAVANLYAEKQAYITKNASDPFSDGDEEAFYKFDNNTNDSTGSYNMTNRNITFSTDSAIGTYSGEFNGTSSEGIISSTTTTPVDFSAENFTISFWAKVDNFTNTVYPVNKWGGSHAERTILTSIRSTGFEDFAVYENNGFGNVQMIHSQTLEANRWYHFAYTRNGSTGTIYIDGVGESFNRTNTINTTNNDIFIGNVSEASTYWFDGYIDSVRLFSRCLDGDEVFKLYAEVIN